MDATNGKGSLFCKGREQAFDEIGFNFVVAIDKTDEVASRNLKAKITGAGLAAIFLVKSGDAMVFFCEIIDDFGAVVGGTVVD